MMTDDRITRIYVLRDPRTNEVRYVGKTVDTLPRRLRGHICDAKRQTIRSSRWISVLLTKGLRPVIELVEIVEANWADRERYWIAHFRAAIGKRRLTNHTDGGGGAVGFQPSNETRLKQGEAHRKRYQDPEQRRLTGEHVRVALADPEWKKQQSKTQKALWSQPDHRAKVVTGQRAVYSDKAIIENRKRAGRASWKSQDTSERRALMSFHATLQHADPITKAIHAAAIRASLNTPASVAKRKVVWREKWADPNFRAERVASMRLAGLKRRKSAKHEQATLPFTEAI